jgi:cold shock CspA family protein
VEGTITQFDEERGLGELDADGVVYPFHCTAIVDGTRTIEVGTPVTFGVRPGGPVGGHGHRARDRPERVATR